MTAQFNPWDAWELLIPAAVIFAVVWLMGTRVRR